jgi:hypothetical protein
VINPGEGGQDDAIRDLGRRWVTAIASADIKERGSHEVFYADPYKIL